MQMNEKEADRLKVFMGQFWKLAKRFWEPEQGDYWDNFIAESDELHRQYKEDPFAKTMILALGSYLEGKEMAREHAHGRRRDSSGV